MEGYSIPTLKRYMGLLFASVLAATQKQSRERNPTRTLIHELGILREDELSTKKRKSGMTNYNVRQVNAFSHDWVEKHEAQEEMAIVPIYRLSEAGDVKSQGDGIHLQVSPLLRERPAAID